MLGDNDNNLSVRRELNFIIMQNHAKRNCIVFAIQHVHRVKWVQTNNWATSTTGCGGKEHDLFAIASKRRSIESFSHKKKTKGKTCALTLER